MDRPTHPVARLMSAIVASLAALASLFGAVLAPAALAGAPANDEYVLEIPGIRQSPTDSVAQSATGAKSQVTGGPRQGVVGENDPPSSPLDSLLSTLGSVPAPLIVGLAALIAIALVQLFGLTPPRRPSERLETR